MAFSWMIQILLKTAPSGPIDNKPALVQIMVRRQAIIWTKMSWFIDVYMRHSASVS